MKDDGMGTLFDFNTAERLERLDLSFPGRDGLGDKKRIERIRHELKARAKEVLIHLFPEGRESGGEYRIGNIRGAPGKSLSISLKPENVGVWKDFALREKGGDLIRLWMATKGVTFPEAILQIESFLRIGQGTPITKQQREASDPTIGGMSREACDPTIAGSFREASNPTIGSGVARRELSDPPIREKKRDLGPPTGKWHYKDLEGKVIATVTRYDHPEGGKEFIPWDAVKRKHTHPKPRPLYNLPGIIGSPVVVLTEGEKCAESLIKIGICATTAMGGAKAPPEKTDWSPLSGKDVIIWPDNDTPGKECAESAYRAILSIAKSVRILIPPEGKPHKWDAYDALQEGFPVQEFLQSAQTQAVQRYRIILSDWTLDSYAGDPPERQWLVSYTFPMASFSILAASGGSGKGMLLLDLTLKVGCEFEADLLQPHPKAFGNDVVQHGTVVIFSAEDDHSEIHRRLVQIDSQRKYAEARHKIMIVPLPNAGGPAPVVVPGKNGPETTLFFHEIREQLMAIKDLKLVIFDPLSSFVMVDISKDSIACAYVNGVFASLASDTGAAVIAAHHLNKINSDKPIDTPQQAKVMISGSARVVDGTRVSYCLWPADQDKAKRVCRKLGLEFQRDKVYSGAVVKENCPVDKSVKTFVRSDNGLLHVMDEALRNAQGSNEKLMDLMVDTIARAALSGRPFTVASRRHTNMYDRKEELPVELRDVGKHRIVAMLNELIEAHKVKKCVLNGSKSMVWLDVPDGPFFRGVGVFEVGFVEI